MNKIHLSLIFAGLLLVAWGEQHRLPVEKEIFFPASDTAVTMGGTLTSPESQPVAGGAVLLSVAGPTDRDGTLGNHKFYRTIAHALAEKGIVTLRYDSRGTGQSGGDLMKTGLADRAGDACRALEALKKHAALRGMPAGFIGMSEGGGVGLLSSAQCRTVDFGVLLSTPVRPGLEVLQDQMNRMLGMSPFPDSSKAKIGDELKRFLGLVSDADPESRREEIMAVLSGPYGRTILPPYGFVPQTPEAQVDFVLSPWYQSQLSYDVRKVLADSGYPLLVLYGELDKVIDPARNAGLVKELRSDASVSLLPGINHLMQEAKTGSPMEYAFLPEAVSAEVTDRIGTWILDLKKR